MRSISAALLCLLTLGCETSGEPHRAALVVVGGIDGRLDGRLASSIKEALAPQGFSVEILPEAIEAADDEAIRGYASRVDAAHAIVLELSATQERPGMLDGSFLWSVSATARVVNEDPSAPTHVPYTLGFVGEAASASTLEGNILGTWEKAFVPHVSDGLLFSPQVDRLFEGSGTTDQLVAASNMKKYVDFARVRRDAKAEYEQFCRAEQERLVAFSDSEGVSCYGDPCGQSVLIGVTAAGRPIGQNVTRKPILTAPPKRKGLWAELPEEVVVYDAGGAAKTLIRSANFYGVGQARYPQFGVVDLFTSEGTNAVLGFDTRDGSAKRVVLLDRGERSRLTEVSPNGDHIFGCLSRAGCYLESDGMREEIADVAAGKWARFDLGQRLLVQNTDSSVVWFLDPAALDAPGRPLRLPGTLRSVVGTRADSMFVVTDSTDGACDFVELDAATQKVGQVVRMPFCPQWPRITADGRVVAIANLSQPDDVGGDDEVVIWDPVQKAPFVLTRGTYREEYPFPSPDGSTVFFNRRLPTPDDSRFRTNDYRRVVCEMELPPR